MYSKIISYFLLIIFVFINTLPTSIVYGDEVSLDVNKNITSEIPQMEAIPEVILTQEVTNSGNTNLSLENPNPILDVLTGGLSDTGIIIPDFKIVFQNPSYLLEKDLVKDVYDCDKSKGDCKVNFDILNLDDKVISNSYKCEIITSFTGTINDCNPNTLTLSGAENEIKFRVIEKNNLNNFKEKILKFLNLPLQNLVETGSTNTGSLSLTGNTDFGSINFSGSVESGSLNLTGGITNTGIIIPDFKIIFQNPSYLFEKDLVKDIYNCDKSKGDCKVNFDILTIDDKVISSSYKCEIITSFTGVINDCNPNTLTLSGAENEIKFRVIEKNNLNNFKEKSIKFLNLPLQNLVETGSTNTGSLSSTGNTNSGSINLNLNIETGSLSGPGNTDILPKTLTGGITNTGVIIPDFKIIFQNPSYLLEKDLVKDVYDCDKSKGDCKVNFDILSLDDKAIGSNFKCEITTSFIGVIEDCNPNTMTLSGVENDIKFKILEKNNLNNFKEKSIKFLNLSEINIISKGSSNSTANINYEKSKPTSIITLQSKISDNKLLEGNKVICLNQEKCSVNLSGNQSYDKDTKGLKFYWDFGNGENSSSKNPKSITYTPGNYKIRLKVVNSGGESDENFFYVEFRNIEKDLKKEEDKKEDFVIDENIYSFLKIYRVLGNTKGSDKNEWVEIKNIGDKDLNLNGLIIDDKIESGSKPYKIKENIYLKPLKNKRFYKDETNLNLNNSGDEINLTYNGILIDSFSWDFDLPDGYILEKDKNFGVLQNVFVERVIDGDTLVIKFSDGKTKKLRLIGVDTPETKDSRKEIERFGLEAYNFTKKFLEGKNVLLELDNENIIDKYDRTLGYIYIFGENNEKVFFNKLLIEKGLGRAYLFFPFKYSKDFKNTENKAKKDKTGVWGTEEMKKEYLKIEKEEKIYLDKNLDENIFKNIFKTGNIEYNIKEFNILLNDLSSKVFLETSKSFKKIIYFDFDKKENLVKIPKQDKKSKKSISKTKNKKIKFTQSISKQKKSLKISGKTIPNSRVVISLGGMIFTTISDINGKYVFKLTKLEAGEFEIQSIVYDSLGNENFIEKTKSIEISESYIKELKKAGIKKKKVKKKKKTKKKKAKTTKISSKKLNLNINSEKNSEEKNNEKTFFILDVLIGILALLLGFLILKRKKII